MTSRINYYNTNSPHWNLAWGTLDEAHAQIPAAPCPGIAPYSVILGCCLEAKFAPKPTFSQAAELSEQPTPTHGSGEMVLGFRLPRMAARIACPPNRAELKIACGRGGGSGGKLYKRRRTPLALSLLLPLAASFFLCCSRA